MCVRVLCVHANGEGDLQSLAVLATGPADMQPAWPEWGPLQYLATGILHGAISQPSVPSIRKNEVTELKLL